METIVWMPEGVFPARAGMIPTSFPRLTETKSIPRESGDDPPGLLMELK